MAINKTIGGNRNTTDESNSSTFTLNDTSTITISQANKDRLYFAVSNPSSKDIILKFQASSVDNLKDDVIVYKRSFYEMPETNTYVGEISAIADSGTPDINVTEW